MNDSKTLAALAKKVGARLEGNSNVSIKGVATLLTAQEGQISFLHNSKYRTDLQSTKASAVILNEADASLCKTNKLIVDDPYYAYAQIAEEFENRPPIKSGIHPTAIIGKDCKIDPSSTIGPQVVIGDQVQIGAHTKIDAGCIIGDNCIIGQNCHLYAHVTFYSDVKTGNRVIIHSGAVIGSDGFGWAHHEKSWYKVPQLGGVTLGDNTDIGANTTIARGSIDDTVIGQGVIIDNLVQIAHNVKIGDHTAIAGCVGIAGSTTIGHHCMIGGAAGIAGHITIADNVSITGMGMITNSIKEPGIYSSGTGFMKNEEWQKNAIRFHHLDEAFRRLKTLEESYDTDSRKKDK